MLKQLFQHLIAKNNSNPSITEKLWNEIEENYSNKKRHYHNLSHLENLFEQLSGVQNQIEDWDTVFFSLIYHDIIYSASSKANEEKSAELCKARLRDIGYPENKIQKCVTQILATKTHSKTDDNDTELFTDADLSILGQEWETYLMYSRNIRKEYSMYPNLLYNPGRKKVLNWYLSMDRIFKTEYFYEKYEEKARENLRRELELLSS